MNQFIRCFTSITCWLLMSSTIQFAQTLPHIKINDTTIPTSGADFSLELNRGDFYTICVEGVNLNNYSIIINNRDTVTSSALDAFSLQSLNIDLLQSLITSITTTTNGTAAPPPAELEMRPQFNYSINPTGGNPILGSGSVSQEVSKLNEAFKIDMITHHNTLVKIVNDLQTFQRSLYTEKTEFLLGTDHSIDLPAIINQLGGQQSDLIDLQFSLTKSYQEAVAAYNQLSPTEQAKKENQKIKASWLETYQNAVKQLGAFQNKLDVSKYDSILTRLTYYSLNADVNENGYTSLPFRVTGDQTTITIRIVPRKEAGNLPTYATSIPIRNIPLAYQSVGVSLYLSGLGDASYSIGASGNEEMPFQIFRENEDEGELGVASLFRIGGKFSRQSRWGAHGTAGIGVNISENIRPRFLLGGGISIGRKHNVSVDVGVIGGYVDRLSTLYEEDRPFAQPPGEVVVSRLQSGAFFSIGYFHTLR